MFAVFLVKLRPWLMLVFHEIVHIEQDSTDLAPGSGQLSTDSCQAGVSLDPVMLPNSDSSAS
jgi:hypothetical protein